MPYAILIASLNILDKPQQAHELAQVLLQLHPNISLSSLPIEPVRLAGPKNRFYEALTLAGIPS